MDKELLMRIKCLRRALLIVLLSELRTFIFVDTSPNCFLEGGMFDFTLY
jgi:hypothetical protein